MMFGFYGLCRSKSWVGFGAKAGTIAFAVIINATAGAQTKPLNDTGINFCGGATSGNNSPCLPADPAGQDRNYGRDDAARTGALPTKIGGSAGAVDGSPNGFDFIKIANNGAVIGPTVGIGAGPTDWACTRDNVTGLVWEVKTTSGLRSQSHTYSWYKSGSPDGINGTATGGACQTVGRCDTEKYVQDVNTAGLCGFNMSWRMPTVKELEGTADFGRFNPAIDPTYFPNTPSGVFWSGSPAAGSTGDAWPVSFYSGGAASGFRSSGFYVRLVRGGQ